MILNSLSRVTITVYEHCHVIVLNDYYYDDIPGPYTFEAVLEKFCDDMLSYAKICPDEMGSSTAQTIVECIYNHKYMLELDYEDIDVIIDLG